MAENILYKVPNKAAMELVGPELAATYPNMGMTPADLLEGEASSTSVRTASKYTDLATEVTAS